MAYANALLLALLAMSAHYDGLHKVEAFTTCKRDLENHLRRPTIRDGYNDEARAELIRLLLEQLHGYRIPAEVATLLIMFKYGFTPQVLYSLYIYQTKGGYSEEKIVRLCLLYTSPSPRDRTRSRMPSSA